MSWTVADVMTKDPVCVSPETPLKEIVQILRGRRISSVPVVDRLHRPLGLVAEEDLAAKLEEAPRWAAALFEPRRAREERARAAGGLAGDLMHAVPHLLSADATVAAAARLMHRKDLHALLVVDGSGRLAGIVTRADLLKVFLRTDAEILRDVERMVEASYPPVPAGALTVAVAQGVVSLEGEVELRTSADRLVGRAAAVPGVIAVRDHLTFQMDDHLVPLAAGFGPLTGR